MVIECPNCHFMADMDDSKIPKSVSNAKCPKCSEIFKVGNNLEFEFITTESVLSSVRSTKHTTTTHNKLCPFCAEAIQVDAVKCINC